MPHSTPSPIRMKIERSLIIVAVLLLVAGCASVQLTEPGTPSIVVKNQERRSVGLGHVVLPTGIYVPDFQTKEGVDYLAPTKLAAGGLGVTRPQRGGLFIPHPGRPDQRQAAWFDQQESSAGLLGAAASSTTRLWRLKEPVAYDIQKGETK